ncbi:MAG: hydroxyacylglutathione hydrolase [Pseudomonadota bacterium]
MSTSAAPHHYVLGVAAAPGTDAPLEVTAVRAFADNYLWLVHGRGSACGRVAVVDPGDARPVLAALATQRLVLDCILVTHHHADHVGGVTDLAERAAVPVYGPARESIPGRTVALRDGDRVTLEGLGLAFDVLEVPGHTAGHVAYVGHGALFCGDTLFSGGCGRLFEGTPAQMLASLDRLARLPPDTRVYCAHEYTASNLRFALAVEPGNAELAAYAARGADLRSRDEASIPSSLGLERRINPFLRTREPAVREAAERHAARPLADDVDTFAVVRQWKNEFR